MSLDNKNDIKVGDLLVGDISHSWLGVVLDIGGLYTKLYIFYMGPEAYMPKIFRIYSSNLGSAWCRLDGTTNET